ncbi:MAG TPA: hypothetical protein DCX77_02885 [Acidimicrobiaceae bacterium]|nr:hypothetical protein [Acidimicrobiaceae bacterium]
MAAQALRFAGPALKALKGILVPRTAAGGLDKVQLAARYAPDLLYSGLSATMLPQGATAAERAGVAAEDLGIGLAASVLGQALGGGAARMAGKRLGPQGAGMAATMGDLLVGAPVNMFAPRPVFEGALNRITEDQYKQAQAQEAAQVQATQEMSEAQAQQELISLLLGAGAFGGKIL